jgi:uncharacterized protein YcnI
MKIFDIGEGWDSKVNFVDVNNVLVGYDTHQSCCEHAGWYISIAKRTDTDDTSTLTNTDVEKHNFDPNYFEEVSGAEVYDGGMVRFKLVNPNDPIDELYLHLFNCHNGYYGHGFTVEHSGTVVNGGSL